MLLEKIQKYTKFFLVIIDEKTQSNFKLHDSLDPSLSEESRQAFAQTCFIFMVPTLFDKTNNKTMYTPLIPWVLQK